MYKGYKNGRNNQMNENDGRQFRAVTTVKYISHPV